MKSDAHVKSVLALTWRGSGLELLAPHSTFANSAIDPGSRLLLEVLPEVAPGRFFDLGCGYGALGLAVAKRFPQARGTLVDRDLLAVEYCRQNARAHGLENVEVLGSLGWSRVGAEATNYDWILANLPARAGERVWARLLLDSAERLAPGGEIFAVVIAPLVDALERAGSAAGLTATRLVATTQHGVIKMQPLTPGKFERRSSPASLQDHERDRIDIWLPHLDQPLCLTRPTDLADEPHRLVEAMPLLARSLPGDVKSSSRALAFRCGYGLLPALLLQRYSSLQVVATDRDILGTEMTRYNSARASDRLTVVEAAKLEALEAHGRFDLIVGELLSPLGREATLAELRTVRRLLAPGGQALVSALGKQWRETFDPEERAAWKLVTSGKSVAVHSHRS